MPQENTYKAPGTKNQKPSGSNLLVRAENVGKIFCRDLKKSLWYGLKDGGSELIPGLKGRQYDANGDPILRQGEFWANKGISFELRRGECLGLIGHNGAGKTTLLKMLNGLIKPDVGKITMRGRVGALIALGAGFNPILTGRENVYIAGSVYGLTKAEIDAKYDEIVEFAELEDFMESPVQNYSSGMQVRLGFAVATAIEPDVLIVDEVLAVGDARFRFKSAQRISKVLTNSAVIFVSHNEFSVRSICQRALYLKKGRSLYIGNIEEAFRQYSSNPSFRPDSDNIVLNSGEGIISAQISFPKVIKYGDSAFFELAIESSKASDKFHMRIIFMNPDKQAVAEYNSSYKGIHFTLEEGNNTIEFSIQDIKLNPGDYYVTAVAHCKSHATQFFRIDSVLPIKVDGNVTATAPFIL